MKLSLKLIGCQKKRAAKCKLSLLYYYLLVLSISLLCEHFILIEQVVSLYSALDKWQYCMWGGNGWCRTLGVRWLAQVTNEGFSILYQAACRHEDVDLSLSHLPQLNMVQHLNQSSWSWKEKNKNNQWVVISKNVLEQMLRGRLTTMGKVKWPCWV